MIDAGTKDSARVIVEKLKTLEAWPVEKIIFTHSHWDHTQGIGVIREKADEINKTPMVFASEKAGPFLADQSYNLCFGTDQAPYDNIAGIIPLKNGQFVEVGGNLKLQIIDTPGHMVDHISIWDEITENLIVGDAFGMKWWDNFFVPNPNSQFWNEKEFLNSVGIVKSLKPKSICLAHFGYLSGMDAQNFLDESVSFYMRWMEFFYKYSKRLDDTSFLVDRLWDEIYREYLDGFKELLQPGLTGAVELAALAYAKQHSKSPGCVDGAARC
ncbi:MAG: MBL fold metallo-hydrolase [Desulfobacteraceae bacterium]|nr:MBL fold metallo-hydrolase [Desulfobacteraceae bacterium]